MRFLAWLDNNRVAVDPAAQAEGKSNSIDWSRIVPFVLMHLACLAVIWVGISWVAVIVALIAYVVRMFAITGL
ncbi:MAG TPA: hypothetical protein VN755_06735, partial [Steroidobacteraceae bacterium]|nr:hypothetical protein [Steroidobacteraceae bacterium]